MTMNTKKKKILPELEPLILNPNDLKQVKTATACDNIKVNIKPKTNNQKLYWKYLRDSNKQIVIASGSAGTGKSFLSMSYALKALKDGEFDEVKILVPTVEASSALKLGYLKGDLESKLLPYTLTTKTTCEKILKISECDNARKVVKQLLDTGKINFEVMSFIRGRTFDNTLLLLEEAENLSSQEMVLALTRCGEGSKIVISGDSRQSDRTYKEKQTGLEHAIEKLGEFEEVATVYFTDEDVVRNKLITKILQVW